tara:strand:+ start:105 stop:449 length:345 start_codon:yes stop_codon:yes gene_type:complete
LVSACLILTTACSSTPIKDGLTVGAVTTAVATAAAAWNPTVGVPILAAGLTSAVTGAVVSAKNAGEVIEAPDNLWSVLEKLVEIGGIGILALLVVPLVAGWLIPGPTKLNRRKK